MPARNVWALDTSLALAYDMQSLTPGGLMADLSGRGEHGTITGTAVVRGKFGEARAFLADTDKVSPGMNIDGYTAFTMMAWAYIAPAFPTRTNQNVFGLHTSSTDAQGTLRLASAAGDVPTSVNSILNAGGDFSGLSTAYPFQAGEWYHIAHVWDGADIVQYINGAAVGSRAKVGAIAAAGSADHLYIGHLAQGASHVETYAGILDEVILFQRALSAAEMRHVAEGRRGPLSNYLRYDVSVPVDVHALPLLELHGIFGPGTTAGAFQLEASPEAAYAGTWAPVGSGVPWAAANAVRREVVAQAHRYVRARVTTPIANGSARAWISAGGQASSEVLES